MKTLTPWNPGHVVLSQKEIQVCLAKTVTVGDVLDWAWQVDNEVERIMNEVKHHERKE